SGVRFRDMPAAVDRLARLRADLGFPADFEFKWNQRIRDAGVRDAIADAFRELAHDSTCVVTLLEGSDRQRAATLLAEQVADLIGGWTVASLVFDEGIIRDEGNFRRTLLESGKEAMRRMQFSSARSFASEAVQCADIFAGFYNLKTRLALGTAAIRLMPS